MSASGAVVTSRHHWRSSCCKQPKAPCRLLAICLLCRHIEFPGLAVVAPSDVSGAINVAIQYAASPAFMKVRVGHACACVVQTASGLISSAGFPTARAGFTEHAMQVTMAGMCIQGFTGLRSGNGQWHSQHRHWYAIACQAPASGNKSLDGLTYRHVLAKTRYMSSAILTQVRGFMIAQSTARSCHRRFA